MILPNDFMDAKPLPIQISLSVMFSSPTGALTHHKTDCLDASLVVFRVY